MSGKGTKRSWHLSFCKRSLSVGLILVLVAALALGKLAYIQLFDGRSMSALVYPQRVRTFKDRIQELEYTL